MQPTPNQPPPLMERAQQGAGKPAPEQGPGFQKPDITGMYPPELKDSVDRIVAAGMKMMYSPDMREELMAEIKNSSPTPKKLAEAIVGLLLTLDKQTKGGLPEGAIFPAAVELLGEAAGVLIAAGTPVSQDDFEAAMQMTYALIGKALKIDPQKMMSAVEQAAGGAAPENEPGEGPAHEQAEGAPMEQQEEAAEAQGMPEPDETQPMRRA